MGEATFYNLIDDLECYLKAQRDVGVRFLEVDRTVIRELAEHPVVVAEPQEAAPVVSLEKFQTLEELTEHILTCTRCGLAKCRTQGVPGIEKWIVQKLCLWVNFRAKRKICKVFQWLEKRENFLIRW